MIGVVVREHFMPIRFGGISQVKANKNLKYVRELDKRKREKILKHSDDIKYFIEFNYNDKIDIDFVIKKLENYGINCGSGS